MAERKLRPKRMNTPAVSRVLTTCAMLGEVIANPWEAMPDLDQSTVKEHVRELDRARPWASSIEREPFQGPLLRRHGDGRYAMLGLSAAAIKRGLLDEINCYDYWQFYAKSTLKDPSGARDRNRKMSGAILGFASAGVKVFPQEKPVPGLTLPDGERPIATGMEWTFWTLKEIRRDLGTGAKEDIAYGKSLGLLCGPKEAYVVYGMPRVDGRYHAGAEERSVRLYERFLRRRARGSYPDRITKALWTGAGMTPLADRVRELDRGKMENTLFGRVYDSQVYISHGDMIRALGLLGESVVPEGMARVDGAAKKWCDWYSEGTWWLNGITVDVSKLFSFRERAREIVEHKYAVMCLSEQEAFYKMALGESVQITTI